MKQTFHSFFLLPMALFLWSCQVLQAQQTLFQGFEQTAGDTWNFTATPASYNVPAAEDFWTDTTVTNNIPPATGDRFWFMLDLDNPSGGGAFFHTLDFNAIDVSGFSNNTLSFAYHTLGYEANDSIGYILETDNGTAWDFSKYVDLNRNTQAWTTVSIDLPAGAQYVRLRLLAKQNGGSDFAGFDAISLFSSNGDQLPPLVKSASIISASSLQLVFTEALNGTAEDPANYTGVENLASASRSASGDTVVLHFSSPFTNGASNVLTISSVEDLAGNPLASPYVFSFVFNSLTSGLVITEINYNPPSNDPDTLEFIEIYNNSSQSIPVGGLQLSGVVSMTLPVLDLTAGATILLAANKAACESFYGNGLTFFQWNPGNVLTNGGNTLLLTNSLGAEVDRVVYDDAFPWPLEPDGLGPSAELLSPNLDNNDGANWIASTTATKDPGNFASPGVVNIATLPTISFVTTRSLVQESAGTITVEVKVDNLNVALAEARLEIVAASTALPGEDFQLLDSVVAFVQGVTTPVPVKITILDDAGIRDSRYLIVRLTDFTASQAGANKEHLVLINDNDTPAPQAQPAHPVQLRHLSSYKIDTQAAATAEISAYDAASKRLFTTNIQQNKLEIIDFKNPVLPVTLQRIDITAFGAGINSVAASHGVVAVAVEANPKTDPGKVVFLDVNGTFLSEVPAGALPDHLNFSPDGSKLLVANEGEPSDDYTVDPEGSVTVIDMSPGAAALTAANATTLGFESFNAQTDALKAAGLRIFGPNASLAQDLEPEYITISDDGKKAFVTLQENNALATINLETLSIESLAPLGLKDWSSQSLDASDNLGGLFFNTWPVKGLYQPDAIAYWSDGANEYLATANEGDVREWSGYAEITRLNSSSYVLDPAVFPDAAYLKRSELLGRLNVSTASGDTDGDGDFDEIHSFGGRSVSIWNATTGALVWDSGDDLERIVAADPTYGPIFNASNSNNTFKNRSDDKGPEPEGVTIAQIEGRTYLFAVLERIGGVMLYDVTNPAQPVFVQWINTRTPAAFGGDQGPEGILFISKDESPNGRNLLVVSNEISGTLSTFQVDIDRTQTGEFALQKYAFDNLPVIGVYGDTLREGGISGLYFRDGAYHLVSDRGPNADANQHPLAAGQTALLFPFPEYAPKVWQVTPVAGELQINTFDFLKRPDGSGVTGLPLPVGFGNTGEVAWSDTLATVLANDTWGIDSEGLTQDNEGNWWVCDEYGASVWQLDANFKVKKRFTPFPGQAEDLPLDSLIGKRRANRGFEGIAYTPNRKVFAILQSPVNNPTPAVGAASRLHRLVELDPATGAARTFVYLHDPVLGQIRSQDWKIGDLAAINNEEFLVLEHAERNGWNAKNIYKINLSGATPVSGNDFGGKTLEQLTPAELAAFGIVPVQKERFVDLLELGWELQHDKPEGLTIVDKNTIAVINDNDFGIASPAADGKIVLTGKTTRLYVYGLPADKTLNYVNPYCKLTLGNDQVACEGDSVVLQPSGDAFAQFHWSDGSSAATLTAGATGTYSLLAETAFGCQSGDTLELLVNERPDLDLGKDTAICAGQTAVLDAGNTGVSYSWSTGSTAQTISVTDGGSFTVTVTNALGCAASDAVVVVKNSNPVVDLPGLTGFCAGDSTSLDAGNAGAAFAWSTGATTSAIQVNSPGTFTVTITDANGCSASDKAQVQENPKPDVQLGNDIQLCAGQSTNLNAGSLFGATYLWSTGAKTSVIATSLAGDYAVTVTNLSGCSAADSVLVAVNPNPVVNLGPDTTLCLGQVLLLDAGNPGASFTWSTGDSTQTLSVTTSELYEVIVTSSFGCTANADILVSVEACTGVVEKYALQGVEVFPNPTTGMAVLRLASLPESSARLVVLNPLGQPILTHSAILPDTQTALDLSAMPKGMYLVQVQSGSATAIFRLILQ
ncbi:MAG: choice-of-anchor I family protein [Saprospiraceae bacterium]|nr:choice-of-anchor I family protein [Saprospiraceae bacterium]